MGLFALSRTKSSDSHSKTKPKKDTEAGAMEGEPNDQNKKKSKKGSKKTQSGSDATKEIHSGSTLSTRSGDSQEQSQESPSKKSKKKKSSKADNDDDNLSRKSSNKKKKSSKANSDDSTIKSKKKKKKGENGGAKSTRRKKKKDKKSNGSADEDDESEVSISLDSDSSIEETAVNEKLNKPGTEGSFPLRDSADSPSKKSESRRSRSLDPKDRRRSSSAKRRSSLGKSAEKAEEKRKDRKRSSSVGKYAYAKRKSGKEKEGTSVASLKSTFDNKAAAAPSPPNSLLLPKTARPNSSSLPKTTGSNSSSLPKSTGSNSSSLPKTAGSSSLTKTAGATKVKPNTVATKPQETKPVPVAATPRSAAETKPNARSNTSDPGKFRNAYLKQVSGGEEDVKTAKAEPVTTKRTAVSPAETMTGRRPGVRRVGSSTAEAKGDGKEEKSVSMARRSQSAEPRRFRNAYLRQVSGGDSSAETETQTKAKAPSLTPKAPQNGKRGLALGGKIGNAYLRQLSGSDDDEAVKTPHPGQSKAPTNRIRNAYLNATKSDDKSAAAPANVERGRPKRLNKPQRRSSSVGKIMKNPVIQSMAMNLMGMHKGKDKATTRPTSLTPDHSPVRRTMNLTALNLATPARPSKSAAPKPKNLKLLLSQDDDASFADSVVHLLKDKSKKEQVAQFCDRIQKAGGLPKTRRLSMKDNDLTVDIIKSIQNDPSVTEIIVDGDVAFKTLPTTLLFQFVEALAMNLHLKKLTFKGVQLGNDILYALATSLETNFVLEELDLSQNLFTSEGLAEVCQAVGIANKACTSLNLENQTTPISVASEAEVLEAISGNKRLTDVKVNFNSDDGQDKLTKILKRNKDNPPPKLDFDKMLIELLSYEAERAEALMEQRKAENQPLEVPEDDWDYLYELAVLFDKYKLKEIVESENDQAKKKEKPKNADALTKGDKSKFLFGQFQDILDDSIACFNTDGSFLTPEFISKYLRRTQDTDELIFDYHGQWKLFKRFPITDPAREMIVTKFVDAIVTHPQMKSFMGINMASTGCADDFLVKLSERCLADPSLLPNLHVLNFETNFINEKGCVALAKLISDTKSLRYLQLVRMENQKGLLTSKAEFALCRAMFVNRSVVVVSLRFRGLLERQQIHAYVSRNVDFLRQARQRHYKKTGTGRKRNETEVFFDKIAANDKSITEVNLPSNRKFLSLSKEERVKAAQAFANNTHVKHVNMNGCELGDEFAEALGKSLASNATIEKLQLEHNSISGVGIRHLFEGVAQNKCLQDLRLHKQSKTIATGDEDALADILDANQSLTKLGIDFRSQNANVKIDRKLKMNDRLKRTAVRQTSG